MFGFTLQDSQIDGGKRSNNKSEAILKSPDNKTLLGYVEISEGPEYGRAILTSVVYSWGIASLIALVISIVIGWFISRQISQPIVTLESVASEMKEGNFAVRAPALKPAELASLSETFNQMAVRIQTNINTLQRFVSDAAHEIRTPLTALRADLTLALHETDAQKTKDLAARALDQVTRLDQLSKDLLDLSKIETENASPTPQLIELPTLLLTTSELHASAAEQAGIDFQLDIQAPHTQTLGNSLQLQRAIGNLLENAVKFTPSGGQVTLHLTTEQPWAVIAVEDNGIGIPSEERALLFNRFHRGRNTHNYPGSGLGLAIAKAIVENHHGEIGCTSTPQTTTFYIKLRISPSPHQSSVQPMREHLVPYHSE